MTTSPESPRPDGAPRPDLLESAAPHYPVIAYVLCGLAAIPAIIAVVMIARFGWATAFDVSLAVDLMLTAVLLAAAIFAVYQISDTKLTGVQKLRLLMLFFGATLGLGVALLGLALPFFHRFSTVFAGGGEAWRKNPLQILVPVIAFIAGLGLTFVSLQMGRGQERESAVMRRVLYGFNAVFSTLLLAAILLLINVLPYMPQLGAHDFVHKFLDANFDWTQSRIYSLSDRTKNTLANLKEPVKVYILLDNGDPLTEQVLTLLQNCQAVDPRLTWEQISSLSFARVQEMPQKLREKITDSHGLLVVYGDEAQGQAQFIRRDKLFTTQPDETGAGLGKVLFQGEGALLQTIRSLTENAEKKPVVYFAQGDGELDFNDGREDSTDGMGVAAKLMRKTEVYELKDLKFGGDVAEVPADADAVVVARPQRMKPAALKAIYNYMGYDYDESTKQVRDLPADKAHKAGKLFVLLDVQVEGGQMLQTGLEPLLRKFGAEPGDGRVLTLQDPTHPTDIEAATSRASRNPVAKAFATPNREIFHLTDVRPMRRSPAPGGPYAADELVVTDSEPVWEEKDLATPPTTLAKAHFKGPFSDEPISLAVAASESRGDMPNDAAHAGVVSEGRPRLVAFGDAGWIANDGLLGGTDGQAKYGLFTSCLSWLRERPDIGATPVEADETKARVPFHPNISEDTAWTIQLLPLAQMTLALFAGGIGVWLVRRR